MASDKETEEGPQEVKPAPRPLVCQVCAACGLPMQGRPSKQAIAHRRLHYRRPAFIRDAFGPLSWALGPRVIRQVWAMRRAVVGLWSALQADDCGKDLAGDKTYYQRHRVCATHLRQLVRVCAPPHDSVCQPAAVHTMLAPS